MFFKYSLHLLLEISIDNLIFLAVFSILRALISEKVSTSFLSYLHGFILPSGETKRSLFCLQKCPGSLFSAATAQNILVVDNLILLFMYSVFLVFDGILVKLFSNKMFSILLNGIYPSAVGGNSSTIFMDASIFFCKAYETVESSAPELIPSITVVFNRISVLGYFSLKFIIQQSIF
jgi:hypothetical protein